MRQLLLSVIMVDPECFTLKSKPIIYTGVFIKLHNWRNGTQAYDINGMIEHKKICTLTAENLHNLGANEIIEISLVLHSVYVVSKDQDKFVIYINKYID